MSFYERCGFVETQSTVLPAVMQVEFALGKIVTSLLGEELVAMQGRVERTPNLLPQDQA
jgi:hypothetical protein